MADNTGIYADRDHPISNVRIVIELDNPTLAMYGDRSELRETFLNYVEGHVRHMGGFYQADDARVEITVDRRISMADIRSIDQIHCESVLAAIVTFEDNTFACSGCMETW